MFGFMSVKIYPTGQAEKGSRFSLVLGISVGGGRVLGTEPRVFTHVKYTPYH
jgi:hypothetical protein